jgi:hypothetical protein
VINVEDTSPNRVASGDLIPVGECEINMSSPKMFIDGEVYSIFKQFSRKGDAKAASEIARRTGLFKHIRVVETPKQHPFYKEKYSVAVRGVARDVSNLTASQIMKETNAPKNIEYDRRTGKIRNW